MSASDVDIELLRARNLVLRLTRKPSSSTLDLICNTVWGTPGAMRYQHLNTATKVGHLHQPWFLSLAKDDETIGVLCLDQRKAGETDAFYIRYFTFAEGMRRKGEPMETGAKPESKGQGLFKRFSSQFFTAPTALLEAAATAAAVFYAFVELENARSRDMVAQMGLHVCGTFRTLIFSRLFHRPQPAVRRAIPAEYPSLRQQVRAAYADHIFFEDHGLFYQDNFFVLEIDGQIVAGCQAHRVNWRVVEIPGWSGKWMMRMLPRLPLLRRLFHPQKFDFAAIEGLFCLPGHENQLQSLLEGVLQQQACHTALLWLSPEAQILQSLQRNVRMGILQKFKKDVPATVVMRGYGIAQEQEAAFQGRPVYISAFDAT